MISFFRRALSSKLVLGLLALIAIAFVITGIERPFQGSLPGGTSGSAVATVGGEDIGEAEMVKRVQNQVDALARAQPGFDMARFIAQGGVEQTVDLTMNARAIEMFARAQGMVASKRLVDGEIASIPAFAGPTGKFDPAIFQNLMAQRRISETELRQDFAREALTKALLIPVAGASRLSAKAVEPYASLLLEKREGAIAIVPSAAFADARVPTDAAVQTFYKAHVARYTVPERRVVRFAAIDGARFAGLTATDAEINAAYAARAAQYAPRQLRRFTQVIVADEAQARAVLARATAGTPLDVAARAVGRDAIPVAETDQAAFAKLTSPEVAAAAFAASPKGFAELRRSGLGFHVVRVDAATTTPATPLSAVATKLAAGVVEGKTARAIADLVAGVEEASSNRATFDELVAKYKLTAAATPAVTAAGASLDVPGFKPDPALTAILRDAFAADADDDPSVTTIEPGKRFALLKIDRVIPSAPRPLPQIRDQVSADLRLDLGARAAKTAADAVAAALNAGTPMTAALARAGRPLPPPQPVAASRLQLAEAKGQIPPPIATMFTIPEKRARVMRAPQGKGWFVVYVSRIESGDVSTRPDLAAKAQVELSKVAGDEYVQQFARAIRDGLGSTRNDAAIARLKQTLLAGRGAPR